MRRFGLLLALLALSAAESGASSFRHDPSPLAASQLDVDAARAAWPAFESLHRSTPQRLPDRPIGRFTDGHQELLLAADGRAALRYAGRMGEPDSAWLGSYRLDGEWIQLELRQAAIAPDGFEAWRAAARQQREAEKAEREAWREEHEARLRRLLEALESGSAEAFAKLAEEDPDSYPLEAFEQLIAMDAASRQAMIDDFKEAFDYADPDDEPMAPGFGPDAFPQGHSQRLLAMPHGDGWLLVNEYAATSMANSWNAYGRLSFNASYWNDTLAPDEDVRDGWRWISLQAPLPARLPAAIAALLLDAPRLLTVAEWLDDPAEPTWKAHEASLRFRVDFGSAHGASKGMSLHGIAPDERWRASLDSVEQDSAIATIRLRRFSPWEAVEVPTQGIRFSTRSPHAQSETCGFDASAAVKASVVEVLGSDAIAWDEDGFAFLRLRIDRGRAHGLMAGDELSAEDFASARGDGRVESADSQQAVVLWRMQRYYPTMKVEPPAPGLSLVTPAWRRQSHDGFGGWNADASAAVVESMQDASELR